jgi:hypothetical protein
MSAAVSGAPLALVAYPQLVWDPAAARHPRGHTYCWRAHFRDLVALARKVHEEQPLALKIASGTERWFVMKLAQMTPSEIEVAIMMVDAKGDSGPLDFLDPSNPGVEKPQAAPPATVVRIEPPKEPA